jgi:hypothetical protein
MKTLLILFIAFTLSAASFSVASAQVGVNANARVNVDLGLDADTRGNATSSAQTSVRGNATSTAAASSTHSGNGQLTAEEHRSTVSKTVQSLLSVADREGGIGAEVRIIAMQQSSVASTSAQAIEKVEKKGKFSTFLFGTDYKSIGELRSAMVTTKNNIAQLKALLTRTESSADRAELEAQIEVLEDSQVELEAFIEANESSFSLFGWLTKRLAQ